LKKLLSLAVVTAFSTTAINANTITLNATIPTTANVTLGADAAVLGNAGEATFTAFNANTVALALTTTAQTLIDENVNLITNNESTAVTMNLTTIGEMTNGGAGKITPSCSYDQGLSGTYSDITAGTAFDLTNGAAADATSNVVGKLKCVTTDVTTSQAAGTYTGVINVAIVAN
jgi:hypothetical protein